MWNGWNLRAVAKRRGISEAVMRKRLSHGKRLRRRFAANLKRLETAISLRSKTQVVDPSLDLSDRNLRQSSPHVHFNVHYGCSSVIAIHLLYDFSARDTIRAFSHDKPQDRCREGAYAPATSASAATPACHAAHQQPQARRPYLPSPGNTVRLEEDLTVLPNPNVQQFLREVSALGMLR